MTHRPPDPWEVGSGIRLEFGTSGDQTRPISLYQGFIIRVPLPQNCTHFDLLARAARAAGHLHTKQVCPLTTISYMCGHALNRLMSPCALPGLHLEPSPRGTGHPFRSDVHAPYHANGGTYRESYRHWLQWGSQHHHHHHHYNRCWRRCCSDQHNSCANGWRGDQHGCCCNHKHRREQQQWC